MFCFIGQGEPTFSLTCKPLILCREGSLFWWKRLMISFKGKALYFVWKLDKRAVPLRMQ